MASLAPIFQNWTSQQILLIVIEDVEISMVVNATMEEEIENKTLNVGRKCQLQSVSTNAQRVIILKLMDGGAIVFARAHVNIFF